MRSANIEIEHDNPDWVSFTTSCVCSDPDHRLTVFVEKDDHDNEPEISIFFKVGVYEDIFVSWPKRMWWRLKKAAAILFRGYLQVEEAFVFRNGKHFEDFARTLSESVEQVRNAEKVK